MAEVTEQIVREAPEIEAIKLGLLESAKTLSGTPVNIPAQLIAGFSPLQQQAFGAAEQGVGAFQPYLTEAGFTLGDSQTALGGVMSGASPYQDEAAFGLRQAAAGISPEVTAAQLGIEGGIDAAGSLASGKVLQGRLGDFNNNGVLDGAIVVAGNIPLNSMLLPGAPYAFIRYFETDLNFDGVELGDDWGASISNGTTVKLQSISPNRKYEGGK